MTDSSSGIIPGAWPVAGHSAADDEELLSGIRVLDLGVAAAEYESDQHSLDAVELGVALAQGQRVVTSQPSAASIEAVFDELAEAGFGAVVCVLISRNFSGTFAAVNAVAQKHRLPIEVIDSTTAGLSIGMAVVDAARCAQRGGSAAEVRAAAEATLGESTTLVGVADLSRLHDSGRMSRLSWLIGGLLKVAPLLGVRHGQIALIERSRSRKRMLAAMSDRVVSAISDWDTQNRPSTAELSMVPEQVVPRVVIMSYGATELADWLEVELRRVFSERANRPSGQGRGSENDVAGAASARERDSVVCVLQRPLPIVLAAHLGLETIGVSVTFGSDVS